MGPTLSGVLGLGAFPGYAGSSQSDCPAAAGVGRRDGALEAHRLLRALRAPWRSGPLQQAARVKGSHGGLPSLSNFRERSKTRNLSMIND